MRYQRLAFPGLDAFSIFLQRSNRLDPPVKPGDYRLHLKAQHIVNIKGFYVEIDKSEALYSSINQ
jgi:hypothetical protein